MAVEEKVRTSGELSRGAPSPVLPTINPDSKQPEKPSNLLHPSFYVVTWISLSSSIILFNKWILSTTNFHFPIILTTWHLAFATVMTQILARTTTLLDGRKTVKMTGRIYLRAIFPIGLFFSLSLICGNLTYLYLSVAFIQMLKATMPVAVCLVSWGLGVAQPSMKVLINVSFIVIGVVIASFGEIQFVLIGFIFQVGGNMFEAVRLVMVERLLSSAEFKMDPLVSLYYFAPVCAIMNFFVSLVVEAKDITMQDVYNVGLWTLLANALVAFALNVSVVFLIGRTSSLVMTLCGILKDILLVIASILIWGTEITPLQMFGYSIAIGGLLYYKLGGDKLKELISHMSLSWQEYGQKSPIKKKIIVFGVITLLLFVLLGGLAPRDVSAQSRKWITDFLGAQGSKAS